MQTDTEPTPSFGGAGVQVKVTELLVIDSAWMSTGGSGASPEIQTT